MGAISLAALLGTIIFFYAITVSNYPNTIPLQAGDFHNIQPLAGEVDSGPLKIKYLSGSYKVPGRELAATLRITNEGKEAVRIGEFATAGLRFLNPDVYTTKVDYPDYLLADRGLSLSDNAPIQPGETKDITATIQDARWDTERLSSLAYDVDSSFAGLLFFYSSSGMRYPIEIGGAVIPQFGEETTQKRPIDRTLNIYYATNRALDQSEIRINYTGDLANNLSFGIMQVRVPDNHHEGNVETDSNLIHVKLDRDYMKDNFVIRGITTYERIEFIKQLRDDKRDTVLIFVHGYNSSFEGGAFRLAQIVWDGQLWNSIPILFSWPSKHNPAMYIADDRAAEVSVEYFIQLLRLLQNDVGIKNVHIIAHSMGNRIVLDAIGKAVDTLRSRPLGEVVFAAADVDQQKFLQVINAARNISRGMTLYASAADAALWWSGIAASYDRAGTVTKDGPVVVEGVESIDMTNANREGWVERVLKWDLLGLNTHNTFVSPVIVDIARLVMKSEHPPDMRTSSMRGVPEGAPRYWRYAD